MAQYDLVLTQNVAAAGVEFTERLVNLTKGSLLTADASNVPAVLAPGTNTYILSANSTTGTGLEWIAQSGGHTQNTDVGTTSIIFELDTDGYQIELTAESASKFGVRVNGGATFADIEAKDGTLASLVCNDIRSIAAGTPDLYSEVTTGSITIGSGLTTGSISIAAVGTGATSINIGHTNSTTFIVGAIDIPIVSAVALGTNASGVVAAATTTGTGTTIALATSPSFVTSVVGGATFAVFDTTSTTINAFGAATTCNIGYDGTAAMTLNISTGATASATTKTINIGTGGAAGSTTAINIGGTTGTTVTVNQDLVVTGNLTVNGTTTTINATTISVDDKNIELGSVAVPDDTTADGGGITLKGATDKTIIWDNANDNWTLNQNVNIPTGFTYKINNTTVLSSTQVLGITLGTMASQASTSYVANSLFDAQTILAATTDNTPAAVTVGEQTLVGRITAGNIAALNAAQVMGILWQTAPGTPTATGTAGWIARDDDFFYICTATNTWRRVPIATNW